ncbi:probable maltase-glucoamylase 2 isoform X5 [Littorina saxatilis]|uniref:Uncharacterized protein n=1 Tax=Littorina saxatilis TaxID=31220 RepID=A0AAN9BFE3_9CAEN
MTTATTIAPPIRILRLPFADSTTATTIAPPIPIIRLPFADSTTTITIVPPIPKIRLPFADSTTATAIAPPIPKIRLPFADSTTATTIAPPIPKIRLPFADSTTATTIAPPIPKIRLPFADSTTATTIAPPIPKLRLPFADSTTATTTAPPIPKLRLSFADSTTATTTAPPIPKLRLSFADSTTLLVVGQEDVVLTCPQEWVLNASVTLYCEVRKSSITSKCDTALNNTFFTQDGATARCTVGPADYHTCSFDNPSSTSCGCRQNATHYTFVYHINEVGEYDGGDWNCNKACNPAVGFQNPLTKYINPACTGVNVTDARTGTRTGQAKSEDGNSVTITLGVVTALGVVVAMVVGAVLTFWYYHRKVKAEAKGQSDQAGAGAIGAGAIGAGAFGNLDAATTPECDDESTGATWQSADTQASSPLFDNSSVSDESSVADASDLPDDSTVGGSDADSELP